MQYTTRELTMGKHENIMHQPTPSLLEIVSKLIPNRSREKERDRDRERMGRDRETEGRSKTVPNELRVIANTVAKLPCWMVFIFDSWVRHSQWKGMLTLS